MSEYISASDYKKFVTNMADPKNLDTYERLCFLKACSELVAETNELEEAIEKATSLEDSEVLSEASDVLFWLVEVNEAHFQLAYGPDYVEYEHNDDWKLYQDTATPSRLLDLAAKCCRSEQFNPSKYYRTAYYLIKVLSQSFLNNISTLGVNEEQLRQINYDKLTKRHGA